VTFEEAATAFAIVACNLPMPIIGEEEREILLGARTTADS